MSEFKGRHFQEEIVLWAVRWYCRYAVSYRDLEAMMTERGVAVDHSTILSLGAAASSPRVKDAVPEPLTEHRRRDQRESVTTDTTKGLKEMGPVLDFADDAETVVLDRQAVDLVAGDLRLAGEAEIKMDLIPVPGLYLYGVFNEPRSVQALMAGMSQPESISLFDVDGQRIEGTSAGSSWSADGILKLKWRFPAPRLLCRGPVPCLDVGVRGGWRQCLLTGGR